MRLYRQGPLNDSLRKCTDLPCCIIFLVLTVLVFVFGSYALIRGDLSKMAMPFDTDRKGCGRDHANHPFIYFPSPHPRVHDEIMQQLWVTVCVSKCPKHGDAVLLCKPNSIVKSCHPNHSANNTTRVEIYDTVLTAHQLCLPTSPDLQNMLNGAMSSQSYQTKMKDIGAAWPLLLLGFGVSLVTGLLLVFFMRQCSRGLVWILFIASIVSLLVFAAMILWPGSAFHQQQHMQWQTNRTTEIVIGITCLLLALLVLFSICAQCHRINLGVRVIETAARFVGGQYGIQTLSVLLFFATVCFLALMILFGVAFYSLGVEIDANIKAPPYQIYMLRPWHKMMTAIWALYTFWGLAFLLDTCSFFVSGTAVNWYFKLDGPYLRCRIRYYMYHTGSVLKGSLLSLIFGPFKLISELLSPDPRQVDSLIGKCKNYLCCLCTYSIFTCYNSGTYSWIQITAQPYCSSAAAVSSLMMRNPASSTIVQMVSKIFSSLGRCAAMCLACFLSYLIIRHTDTFRLSISQPIGPLVAIAVISFAVSSLFLSLYSDATEGIYISYLMEADLGSDWNCPAELKQALAMINRPYQPYFI